MKIIRTTADCCRRPIRIFFNVVVEDTKPHGTEEEITFLADRNSFDFTISNIEVIFD